MRDEPGGVVYAWCFNLQGQLGVNNTTTQQAQALGVHMQRNTVPLQWSEHLCNGSPARIVACGDHHTLVLMQGAEVLACGSNINAEGKLRIGTRNSEWYPTGLGGIGSV